MFIRQSVFLLPFLIDMVIEVGAGRYLLTDTVGIKALQMFLGTGAEREDAGGGQCES